ncbi:MAG: cysteine rich repeat-containing protein [Rhodomicrobium sp.]
MKIALYAPLAGLLLVFSPQIASAQSAHPCKADREKFCPDLKPGDGKFGECMKQHEAELSPECAAERKDRHEAWKNVRANCKDDAGKFCGDTEKGHGAMLKCLESHAGELGQACADALKAAPGGKKS